MVLRFKSKFFFAAGLLVGSAIGASVYAEAPTPDELFAQLADPDPAKQADARQKLFSLGGDDVGVPVNMLWDVITATRDIEVPFEFKDLPMP